MKIRILYILLHFIGVYTQFGIETASYKIPNIFVMVAFPIGLLTLITSRQKLSLKLVGWTVLFVLYVIFVNVVSYREGYLGKYITGAGQLFLSVISGLVFCFHIVKFKPSAIAARVTLILCLMAGISVLEVLGFLAEYSSSFVEVRLNRDLNEHGGVRAAILTPETANAAVIYCWLSCILLWAVPSDKANTFQRYLVIWLLCTAVMLFTVRSFFVMVGCVAASVTLFSRYELIQRKYRILAPISILFISISIPLIAGSELYKTRLENIIVGNDGSFYQRFIVPFEFMVKYFDAFNFYGVGVVGDLVMIEDEIQGVYFSNGFTWMTSDIGKGISNFFGLHFVYFGFFGGLIACIIVWNIYQNCAGRIPFVCGLQIAAIFCMMGGYVSALPWTIGFSLAVIAGRRMGFLRGNILN